MKPQAPREPTVLGALLAGSTLGLANVAVAAVAAVGVVGIAAAGGAVVAAAGAAAALKKAANGRRASRTMAGSARKASGLGGKAGRGRGLAGGKGKGAGWGSRKGSKVGRGAGKGQPVGRSAVAGRKGQTTAPKKATGARAGLGSKAAGKNGAGLGSSVGRRFGLGKKTAGTGKTGSKKSAGPKSSKNATGKKGLAGLGKIGPKDAMTRNPKGAGPKTRAGSRKTSTRTGNRWNPFRASLWSRKDKGPTMRPSDVLNRQTAHRRKANPLRAAAKNFRDRFDALFVDGQYTRHIPEVDYSESYSRQAKAVWNPKPVTVKPPAENPPVAKQMTVYLPSDRAQVVFAQTQKVVSTMSVRISGLPNPFRGTVETGAREMGGWKCAEGRDAIAMLEGLHEKYQGDASNIIAIQRAMANRFPNDAAAQEFLGGLVKGAIQFASYVEQGLMAYIAANTDRLQYMNGASDQFDQSKNRL